MRAVRGSCNTVHVIVIESSLLSVVSLTNTTTRIVTVVAGARSSCVVSVHAAVCDTIDLTFSVTLGGCTSAAGAL